MPTRYITKQGETVDLVCNRHYGRTASVTEAVLAGNPGLAALGPVLPMGTVIQLPDIDSAPGKRAMIGLWD